MKGCFDFYREIKSSLLLVSLIICFSGVVTSLYFSFYFDTYVADESIPTCQWIEDVWKDECIHYQFFQVEGKNFSTRIFQNCFQKTPFVDNQTYWCKCSRITCDPYQNKPLKKRNSHFASIMAIFSAVFLLLLFFMIALSFEETKISNKENELLSIEENELLSIEENV